MDDAEKSREALDSPRTMQEWFDRTVKMAANHHALFLAVFELLEKDCGVPKERIIETIEILRVKLDEKGYGDSTAQDLINLYKKDSTGDL